MDPCLGIILAYWSVIRVFGTDSFNDVLDRSDLAKKKKSYARLVE